MPYINNTYFERNLTSSQPHPLRAMTATASNATVPPHPQTPIPAPPLKNIYVGGLRDVNVGNILRYKYSILLCPPSRRSLYHTIAWRSDDRSGGKGVFPCFDVSQKYFFSIAPKCKKVPNTRKSFVLPACLLPLD